MGKWTEYAENLNMIKSGEILFERGNGGKRQKPLGCYRRKSARGKEGRKEKTIRTFGFLIILRKGKVRVEHKAQR